jgi:nicotinamidase-related amidase
MSLKQIDSRTALIIIDLQAGILAGPVAHSLEDILAANNVLLDAFHRHHLPVGLVVVGGQPAGRTEFPPAPRKFPDEFVTLDARLHTQSDDEHFVKNTWGAFTQTGLEAWLRKKGVTQVVITGVATSIGVESTARQAHELGLNVVLAVDAMSDRTLDAHATSVAQIFPKLGERATAAEIVALLDAPAKA